MTQVFYVFNTHIIAKVATDDGAIVQSHLHAQIVEFKIIGF